MKTQPDTFAPAARLSQAVMALMEMGQVVIQQPTLADLANGRHEGCLWLLLASSSKLEAIEELVTGISDLAEFQVQPYEVAPPSLIPGASPAGEDEKKLGSNGRSGSTQGVQTDDKTVRISVERLDTLMNLVGELVTSRNRFLQVEGMLRHQEGRIGALNEIGEVSSHFSRIVDQLQEEVMRARMLPIARFFVVVSEMSHKTDNNGFKKGTDFGFFYPFISAIRCCFVV